MTTDPFSAGIGAALRAARTGRGLPVAALAERSGVSRAMIAKIERGGAQPTAALLARLAGALGLTLSELVARIEGGGRRLARAEDQPVWTDPATGYRRRAVSPAPGGPIELVEVHLPPGARVDFPPDSYALVHQQIWVLDGALRFEEGGAVHDLAAGDCLELGDPQPCAFVNTTAGHCRYLVALTRRGR